MEDSYVSDDSYSLIDEVDVWSSADDSAQEAQEHLEIQSEASEADEPPPRMSPARKLYFAVKSLSCWREKARVKQEKNRSLEKTNRDLSLSRDNWKNKAIQIEKQLKALAASKGLAAQKKVSFKQTIISIRE